MSALSRIARLIVVLTGCITGSAHASLIISEVLYDAVGNDNGNSFIELYGTPGLDLGGYNLQGINGATGLSYMTLNLSGIVPTDGVFVIADNTTGTATNIANADLVSNFDFQNGPDSILLRFGTMQLNALGYGVFGPGEYFAGEGSPAPATQPGQSLARRYADVDTGNNAVDFIVTTTPTPGSVDLAPTQQISQVPVPASAVLLVSGVVALFGLCRRKPVG